jgi:butyrate kinase
MERTERQADAVIVKLLHLGNGQVISAYPDSNLIDLSQPASTRTDFKPYRKGKFPVGDTGPAKAVVA